jgi:DNA-binding NarL/FixJ family response regulator
MAKEIDKGKVINIVLVEDHNIVRDGIRSLLEKEEGLNVSGEAGNGVEALSLLASGVNADVIIADMNMPEMNGVDLIKQVKELYPEKNAVVLSMLDHEKYIYQAFVAGAQGYLLKNVSADELVFAIKHIDAGGKYLCSELAFKLLDKSIYAPEMAFNEHPDFDLSKREAEVLNLIAEGLTNTQIADKLFTSKRTVEGHRFNLMSKTNSKNTAALIKFAVLNVIIA